MINKKEFLTIYTTYRSFDVVKQLLPSVVQETKNNDAALIVWDTSPPECKQKHDYLNDLNKHNDFYLAISSNASVATIRNTCMFLGQQMYIPDYICIIDDDHGYKPGLIKSMVDAIKKYYGKKCPNGFVYGLFTGCNVHRNGERILLPDGHAYPGLKNDQGALGGTNGCFRCSTTAHWNIVLKGYDIDQYPISIFQTDQLALRNYMAGFTTLIVDNGNKAISIEHKGRGTSKDGLKLWDNNYCASDYRAKFAK